MTEKEEFSRKLEEFVTELKSHVSTDDGQWTIKGFIDIFKNVYTISSDTKMVSKILEIHLFPKILAFAQTNKYKVVLAEYQNYYPDMLTSRQPIGTPKNRIYAMDLRWAHMVHILRIESAPKTFSFPTVRI